MAIQVINNGESGLAVRGKLNSNFSELDSRASTNATGVSDNADNITALDARLDSIDVLTTKGDVLVHDGSDYVRLPVGSNGQALTVSSTEATGLRWATISGGGGGGGDMFKAVYDTNDDGIVNGADEATTVTGPQATAISNNTAGVASNSASIAVVSGTVDDVNVLTTKGDLATFTTEYARLPVGANGLVLTADSTRPSGLKWATASGGAAPAFPSGYVVADEFAVGDGVIDDSANLSTACASLGAAGGTVYLGNKHYRIATNLTIPASVTIRGPHNFIGGNSSPFDSGTSPFDQIGGALLVDSTATITMGHGSSLEGILLYRYGMSFPDTNWVTSFQGTAITATGRDVYLKSLMILGFNKAISNTDNGTRLVAVDILGDCTNGIFVEDSKDVAKLDRCHFWPFATAAADELTDWWKRAGTAYYIGSATDTTDWPFITNCFSFGYLKGFDIDSCNGGTFLNCSADGIWLTNAEKTAITASHPGSIGFHIHGSSSRNRLIGCEVSSKGEAYVIDTFNGLVLTTMESCQSWTIESNTTETTANHIRIDGGDVFIKNHAFEGSTDSPAPFITGVRINDPDAYVFMDYCRFRNIKTRAVNNAGASQNVLIGEHNKRVGTTGTNPISNSSVPNLTQSSNVLTLPYHGSVFNVTGTTGIVAISGYWEGRRIWLRFNSAVTVNHGDTGDGGIVFESGSNLTTSSDLVIELTYVNGKWREGHYTDAGGNDGVVSGASFSGDTLTLTRTEGLGDLTAQMPNATASTDGSMSSAKFNEIEANNAKVTNQPSNLGTSTFTNAVVITNTDGTDATINGASTSAAGVMIRDDKVKLNRITVTSDVNLNNSINVSQGSSSATITAFNGTSDTLGLASAGGNAGLLSGSGATDISLNTAHRSSNGSDHSYVTANRNKLAAVTGSSNSFYPISTDSVQCGFFGQQWSLVRSNNFIVGTGGYNDTMDDLAVLHEIEPYHIEKEVDGEMKLAPAVDKHGFQVMDVDTLPDFMLGPDTNPDGRKLERNERGVDFTRLGYFTTGSVKQLDLNVQELFEDTWQRVTTLEKENAELKARLSAIESLLKEKNI